MAAVQILSKNKMVKAKVSVPFNHMFAMKEEEKVIKMTPSAYTQEMLQSTEERLANTIKMHAPRILELLDMTNTTFHKLSLVDVGQALFQPYPTKLVFQNFTPGETYKLPLQLFNRDKVSRYVKLEQQDSEYFHVVGPEDASGKVAPGLSATFAVLFTPQDYKDYQHRLICVTERERFEIPIVGIGPRAILDFRDEILLPVCSIKATTEKTQLVRNIGNSKAKFKLHTARPFSVSPSFGSLDVGESLLVTVTFSPINVGDHRQDLLLHYHTGEDVYIRLYGACEELNIQLDSDLVLLNKTYISLSSVQTVSLTNTSDIPLYYYWTTWSSRTEEEPMFRESAVLQQREDEEASTSQDVHRELNPAAIHRLAPLSRTAKDCDLSNEGAITLEPMQGEIWPKMTAKFHIIFKPEAAALYQHTLYCDVTGCESRLCLTIKGEGIGPKLEPSYDLMDMKNVFIGDTDWFEVTLTNKGLIDAPFRLSSRNTTFGRFFSFSPEEGVVPPGACQTVKVTFSSSVLGTFSEDLLVTVKGQPQPLTLNFRGCVIGPTFHFDVTELNFGDFGFGFPQTAICTLFNTSFVPMTFSLRVPGDGLGPPSVTCVQQVDDRSRNQWQGSTAKDRHVRPKEFTITPAADSVPVMSEVTIKVTLCSNSVKRYRLVLAVDVKGVGKEIMTLPINARCVVPVLEVETPMLDYKSCFLNLPYEQKVQLVNTSSVPACYGLLDQDFEENPSIIFERSLPRGVILPHSSEALPVFLKAKDVGRCHRTLRIAVFGSTQPPLDVVLSCIGQGPIVRVQNTHLDFGRIPVLKDITKALHLLNQSPIPAHFSVCMRQKKSFWRVEPREGEVPSEGQLELRVVAHLKDTLHFEDELEVSIQDSGTFTVAVYGRGTGTTIVSDKPFAPSLDLGTHFSHGLYQYHFKLTNLGLRTHRMYWRTVIHKETKPGGQTSLPPIFPTKKKNLIQRGSMGSPVFSLSPSRVELFPGHSVDMTLTGSCNSAQVVHERLACNSIVGNQGSSDNIMTVDVTCCFMAPMLSIFPKQMDFYIEKTTGKSITPLYKKLVLKNVSALTLSMELSIVEPFSLCEAQGAQSSATTKSVALGEARQAELWVCLNPAFCDDRVSRVLREFLEINYRGHPQQDVVELHGEVHFPNLLFSSTSLDFGCVLNSTETQREITITNSSPLPVVYRWTFLDKKYCAIREAEEHTLSLKEDERHFNEEKESNASLSATWLPFSPVSSDNEQRSAYCPVKVEEIFDVLPIFGRLQPGEQQVISFSFFGHEYVSREVVAQCHVEDGPTYEVTLRGEASEVSFSLDYTCVNFGQQLFDHVAEAEVILKNTGKVGFKFRILNPERDENTEHEATENRLHLYSSHKNNTHNDDDVDVIPGQPMVFPSKGFIDAGAEKCLRVFYLPGIPEVFEKKLQLQVACLPLQDITLIGEGLFPRVILTLPRNLSQACFTDVIKQAKETVKTDGQKEYINESTTGGATEASYTSTYQELLEMEIERILVKENALSVTGSLLEFKDLQGPPIKWNKLSKCLLPEYVLDFGYVIVGRVLSQTVHIINNGSVTVSLTANHKALVGTGFSAEFERVKNLPCGETHTFTIRFDAQEVKLPLGSVCAVLPIQVRGGPTVHVQLCAVVTMPGITVSTERLQFDTIQCSMCQMKTVQLFNHESVPCQWSIAEEVKLKKVNKFLLFYQRKQQPPPVVFEVVPSSGLLFPGERVNVQVKFTPLEEELYSKHLVVSVAESCRKVVISAQGEGEEPQLEFCPPVLQLGPCLPFSTEVEAEVTVKNPCSFPIEFYCMELDKQYLEEEKILRLMQGYDDNNRLLLPSRIPGESLPQELLDFYKHYCSKPKDNADNSKSDMQIKKPTTVVGQAELLLSEMNREGLHKELGHLQTDPVSRAIARHIGVDLSPDSLTALNRRGIAIIVYGAPNTGINSTAASLAHYYGGALLSVDALVTEVLLKGTSPISLAARQHYEHAAAEYAKTVAHTVEKTKTPRSAVPTEFSDVTPNSACSSPDNGEHIETETMQIALCLGGDMASLKNLLPEPLLSDILTERFQSSDCHRGIVIDGLKSVYTKSVAHTLQIVLKALSNRKHIYVVNLFDSYTALLKRESAQKEAEDAQRQAAAENERQWLQDLDEEEYDALPEEKKHIIQQHRQRLTKDKKRLAKEHGEQRQQEDLKRLKEEELKKNDKKGMKKESQRELSTKKKFLEVKVSNEKLNQRVSSCQNSRETLDGIKDPNISKEAVTNLPHAKDHEDCQPEETKALQAESPVNTEKLEKTKFIVNELHSQFLAYEQSHVQVQHILQHWDRVQGLLLVPVPGEDGPGSEDFTPEKPTPLGKGKGKKAAFKVLSPQPSRIDHAEDKLCPADVIPHLVINLNEKDHSANTTEHLIGNPLPTLDEILDEFGLGPSGPPIPPPVTFSLVPVPKNRAQAQLINHCFTFLVSSDQEEQSHEKKEEEDEVQTPLVKPVIVPKGRARSAIKEIPPTKDKDKEKKIKESQKGKTKPSAKTKTKTLESSRNTSYISLTSLFNDQHQSRVELKRSQSLSNFRWIVPANGEVILKIWFYSEAPGTFEQAFNFELVGTQKHFQLLCNGTCTYPSICKDHTTLFAYSNKVPHIEDGLKKTYIIKPGFFEFGPLLCSKTRDRYKENKYPDNIQKLLIHNTSGLQTEIQFNFQNDIQAITYLLEPPTMTLKPDEKQELTVWAYPTKLGQIKDSIVCKIKDNPESVVINLSCWGVRPELELDTKSLPFDKTVILRRVSRTVNLSNKTALPVSWKLQGIDDLGEFSVPQDQGIVPPHSTFPLSLHFRAKKPLHIKKTLRLEVSDVEKILGIVQTETISVSAEAYDVSINLEPGCLDFGTIKVFDEAKPSVRIRNNGKYEIAYKFTMERTKPNQPNLDSLFSISPQSGKVMPHDKSATVQIICKPKTELSIKEQPILLCQVIEPNIGERGEIIVTLLTKVSVQAVFSRYKITPVCDINFGPLALGSKKTQTFTIENTGVFETRFAIHRLTTDSVSSGRPGCKKPLQDGQLTAPIGKGKLECTQRDMGFSQTRMTVGVFTVYPYTGTLLPGSQQVVTVDCVGDHPGNCDQGLLIDISDRDPLDHPDGIPYRLLAEVYKTGIQLNTSSIFEEHFLCHTSSQLSSEKFANAKTVYVTEENKFIFNKVLVGKTAKARFKLTNNTKVPCNLNLTIRYVFPKLEKASLQEDIFHLSPTTLSLPGQSHSFAEVTFTPTVTQRYHAVFETTMDGPNRMTGTNKSKVLEFDIMGEGTLPSVCVIHPALKNSAGEPLLQFRRVFIGQKQTRSVVLLNDGNTPSQVQLDMPAKDGVFTLKAAPGNSCSSIKIIMLESSLDPESRCMYRAITKLNVKEQVEFEVTFCSEKPQKVKNKMCLQVEDNQYNKVIISVTGEAYQEIVSLDNIRRPSQETDQAVQDGNYEVLDFDYCYIDVQSQESFTMINHSKDKVLRFEWPPSGPQISFSPQVGHLHAGCSKEVTVTFRSGQPITLISKPMKCKVSQVVFREPLEEVADWDDQQKTVHWQSVDRPASAVTSQQPVDDKVIKTNPEPSCSVVDGLHLELELRINAVCDYAKFSCTTNAINFKDTMLYQTRLQQVRILNEGNVRLAFSWKVQMNSSNVDHEQTDDSFTSRPGSRSSGAVTQARAPSALSQVVSLLNANPQLPPFSVEPSVGSIEPKAMQEFNICFSPLKVAQFEGIIICSIPNLQKKDQSPCISVCGRSLMPHCHFDLEDSDYISGKRRSSEFRSPLDPKTRVVEFHAVGLSASTTKCFSVLNPTNKPYSFKWRCEDKADSPFHCLTSYGTIQPREKAEVRLEYVSEQLDVVESLWSFVIDTLSVSVPFLFVGATRTPLVYLDKVLIDFGDLLVGHKAEQTANLVNGEGEPFHFSALQPSLLCEDQLSSLVVRPMTGSLAPKERFPLSVSFTPNRQGYVNFRVLLKVKRMLEPLALTVKAECFSMSTLVQVEKPSGGFKELKPNHFDSLDFEKVGISEQSSFRFLVSNLAKRDLDITFDIAGPSNLLQHLKAEPKHATVQVGKQLQLSLFFCPLRICNLQEIRLNIKVKHGPTFTVDIKGRGVAPSLEFSFTKFNFGKCFVFSPGMVAPSQTLVIRNIGQKDISVLCQFKNTPYLQIGFQPSLLAPGADVKVPITFYPQEACRYQEKLTFILNSCVTKQVDILGQGIEMKLDVEDPRHRKINLGSLALGKKAKKCVVLVNRSPVSLAFSLLLDSNTPLDPKDLSLTPTGQLNLNAGKSCTVEIQFSPRQHIGKFTAELQAEILGLLHPLLTIRGCCQGVEVHLDQDHVAFGAVVQHCQTSKKIVMINTGDIGGKFSWKTERFPSTLSISPTKGCIWPGMEVPFEVSFAPVELSNDIRYENLPCVVEGWSSPITLTVTGSCVVATINKEAVNFVCPVRGSHTQTLSVLNPTNQCCTIRPVIKGEQWTGTPIIVLEPLQNKTFEVVYHPLTMTTEGNKHLGSVFFPFPDGTGMFYSLQGTAEAPKAEDTLVHELPAKTQYTELLSVHNWLLKQQRFHVVLEILKFDKLDATVTLSGLEYIDVPALTKRDYKLSFFTYKQGQYNTKVTFCNESSGEYFFYLITFKATSSRVLSTIELVTTVRQAVSATVQVENPLTANVCLSSECKSPDISVPLQHTVPGRSKDTLSFEYLPLQAGRSTARLTLSSNELGYFHYDLLLRALPPTPEKTVHFTAPLGTSQSVVVKFTNFSRSRTDYFCKTDCPDFMVDKSVSAVAGFQAGSEASVEVCFEPHQLGEVRGQLTLHSALGGEYIFPLHGDCQPPKPQGPFSITVGRPVPIPFKNVFLQTTTFSYQMDNPLFTVKGVETINSKRTQNILVSFEVALGGTPGPWFGKLTISSLRTEIHRKPCSWVFYLKGCRPSSQ